MGQLAERTREDILKHRQVGEKTIAEINRLLAQNGLSLKDSKIPVPIIKDPMSELEIIGLQEKIQSENKKLRAEVESLRNQKFQDNLKLLRMETKIKDLEQKLEKLTMSTLIK